MERIKEMMTLLEIEKSNLINSRIIDIQNNFIYSPKREEMRKVVKGLCVGKRVGCVSITYLRSSYITGTHDFCIAYYAEQPFWEENPDCYYINLQELFIGVETDYNFLENELHKKFIRVLDSEIDKIHRWYMSDLYEKMVDVFKKAVRDIFKEGDRKIYYGGYMEEPLEIGEFCI